MRPALALALVCSAGSARAELRRAEPVIVPAAGPGRADPAVVKTLVLDRCASGCTVHTATFDDATTNTSSIPGAGTYHLSPFAYTDTEWAQLVTCVRDVYSPYAITITDALPASGDYNKALVAGLPAEVGLDPSTLGIALLASDCHPLGDAIAFAFANAHPHDTTFIDNLCWTVAQESAHLYGLDHEFVFTNGVSACSDPMTYRGDCGGEKFFRPREAYCGRVAQEVCRCGDAQSSHRRLLARLGPATPTTAAPVVDLREPAAPGALGSGATVVAHASAQRGVDHVDLLINGFAWASVPGVAFGAAGQPDSDYTLTLPPDVPDGVIALAVAAVDDLGVTTRSAPLAMMKGAACTSADTCAPHQTCNAGACLWSPAMGTLGEACGYPQQCVSGLCEAGACSQACDIDDATSCPAGFECNGIGSDTAGLCAPLPGTGGGGCCQAGTGGHGAALLGLGLAALWRRRAVRSSRS